MSGDPAKKIGKRIKRLRLDADLTQVSLAEKAGVEANTVARLERGEHQASTPTLQKLAKALGVKVSDILDY